MKYKSTRQNLHNHLHGVDSTEYVPGKKERFSSISLCTRQERFCFRKDKSDKTPKNTATTLYNTTTTTSFICVTIQTHTVLKKLCLGIKITTQGNYVTLLKICHEHQNKLKYILGIVYSAVY